MRQLSAVAVTSRGKSSPSSNEKRICWVKETGFGLVKVTLQFRLNGSIWPSSPQQAFTSEKKINFMNGILKIANLKQVTIFSMQFKYSKTCLKLPFKNRQNKDLTDKWLLNEGRKYYRMPPLEHSVMLLTCIKRHSVLITNFGLERPLNTGFTVLQSCGTKCLSSLLFLRIIKQKCCNLKCLKKSFKRRPKNIFSRQITAKCRSKILQQSAMNFQPALSYHLSLRPLFCLFLSGSLRQVSLY